MNTTLRTLFGYHAWANADLFATLERLDPAAHRERMAAAIRLINHHHVVARIFAAHLAGTTHGYTADNAADAPALGALRAAVTASDRWYLDFVRDIRPAELAEAVAFVFTDGDAGCMSREEMLIHVVMHAGYHRGEVGRILAQSSVTPPWDTLAVFLHQTEPARRLRAVTPQPA